LKATTREGFGGNLFYDWRMDAEGQPRPNFVLNNPLYSGHILVAGKNFGSGSSREHAAWALADYGFRVIVSAFFADIFRQNALNNFVLPVTVSESFLWTLFHEIEKNPQLQVEVDLPNQAISITNVGVQCHFDVDPYKKHCLLTGQDDIEFLLSRKDKIERWESAHI
jgi:3-isopropylmalate/(R)-2-methylmalate dehydratase small subunit